MKTTIGMVLALALAAPVMAAAPQPSKPVSTAFYSGKWYEIARLPSNNQKDCVAGQSQFTAKGEGGFSVVQTCRVGKLDGPLKTYNTSGKIIPSTNNAKFQLAFFGGAVKQEYWVIDRDDGLDWAVMGTPGGNFAWLMARRPTLSAAVKSAVVARLKAAGYKTDRLIFPPQTAG